MKNERDQQLDLTIAGQLLSDHGVFQKDYYSKLAGPTAPLSPVEHYLLGGWRQGLEPAADFEGGWLYPYFASAGFSAPPALTYATLRGAGAPVYRTREDAEAAAEAVRSSGMFDAKQYLSHIGNIDGLDPVLHYVIVGERLGYAPSDKFDPAYYLKRYPDIALTQKTLLEHFITTGRAEGRRPVSVASELTFDNSQIDPNRETILLVTHQASRTGAPILAYNIAKRLSPKYNIVTLVLLNGELYQDFERYSKAVIGPVTTEVAWVRIDGVNYVEGEYIAKRLNAMYSIKYAIVNSIDSRTLLKPLMCEFIPTVTLVHEFPADLRTRNQPPGEMGRWLEWTDQIVFSAEIVANLLRDEYPHLVERPVHILPQGPCELPPRKSNAQPQQAQALRDAIRPPGIEDAFVVLACGTVFDRKGPDLFVACAARAAELAPQSKFRFTWIGHGYDPVHDKYSRQLQQQIADAGLTETVSFLKPVTDLEPAYASADIFFLSSRLDPLPNVGIDSALRGLPIVCFAETGGIAELLARDITTSAGVVPSLDVDAAAKAIVELAGNGSKRSELGHAIQRAAKTTFDMDSYIRRLDDLGQVAGRMVQQRRKDFETLLSDPSFDMTMFLDPHTIETTREESIRLYLARAGALSTSKQPTANFYFRRPAPGFHPQIYVHDNAGRYDLKTINPLAHFIRSGKLEGPWRHDIITPADFDASSALARQMTIAIHGHFYYPELISELLKKLATNSTPCDLLLSTNDTKKASQLAKATRNYRHGKVSIQVFPNRGRDIGVFLTGFRDAVRGYDLIGHLHGKRSYHTGDMMLGEQWREFLWQNLLGGLYSMMDVVTNRFAKDDKLGLVFASDPHLSDWDLNRDIAEDLAKRMGRDEPLPPYFDFPIGTMFWARPRALEPLLKLNLDWKDYPEEPAPLDGTVLHAIERLLPFAAREAGYKYATTYIPGMTW